MIEPLHLQKNEQLHFLADHGLRVCGPGIKELIGSGESIYPHASTIADLARREPLPAHPDSLTPVYLRETTYAKAPPRRIIEEPERSSG
jgi:hypothetical protein